MDGGLTKAINNGGREQLTDRSYIMEVKSKDWIWTKEKRIPEFGQLVKY